MATYVDSLISQIKYEANSQVLRAASEAVNALDASNRVAAESAENRKLAEYTDTLTNAQIDLTQQLSSSAARVNKLRDEQRELQAATAKAGKATDEQKRRLAELDSELGEAQHHSRELREENARLGLEKRRVAQEARKLQREQKDLAASSRKAAEDQRRLTEAMRSATAAAEAEAGKVDRLTEMIQGVAGGELAADAIRAIGGAVFDLGKEIITTGANFESLRARLKTVEGTTEGAGEAFRMIQDFAKSTPFSVQQITESFTALRVRGVQPTTEKLTALGDLSSAFGQDFGEITQAIGAAARAEFDPIEKFGISMKKVGDQVRVSFKGQTQMVALNSAAITDALVGFGKMSGIQGAMAEQSMTTAGMFSNLKDTVDALFDTIAQMGVLDEVKLFMEALSESMGSEGLSQVIADVLVMALRTARELFLSLPQETLIEFLSVLVELVGLVVNQLMGVAGEGAGVIDKMLQFATVLVGVAGAIYDTLQRLDEIRDKFEGIPGPLDLILKGLELLLTLMGAFATVVQTVLDVIAPFLDKVSQLVDRLPSLNDIFSGLGSSAMAFAADLGIVNAKMEETASVAQIAFDAMEKLAARGDYKKKTNKELQELSIEKGDEQARAEIRRRAGLAEGAEKVEESADRRKAKSDAQGKKVDTMLDNPGRLTRVQLDSMAGDSNLTEKQRDKVQKEIDKRDNKRSKDGAKAGKKVHDSLLTAKIEKDIEALAEQAGQREAARAIESGASSEEANKRELGRRKQVKTQLTHQFQETGALPPGIMQDIAQVANLPNIEQVGGRLAPPVITVNNYRVEVTGNSFTAAVSVGSSNATAGEIATAVITQAQPVTFQDLGRAVLNNTTTMRR
jgi:hypothetical protein